MVQGPEPPDVAGAVNCCSPSREPGSRPEDEASPPPASEPDTAGMLAVPGGRFVMGERSALAYPGDGDEPVETEVEPFLLDATAVTNEAFTRFVAATGHVTDAERHGWSFVFGGLLPDDFPDTRGVVGAEWWRQVFGADWQHPEGPHSDLAATHGRRAEHPVVHVSWRDARAFTAWRGVRLPTEAEWERAARAGTDTIWPWGDEREPAGAHAMNVWQGSFPDTDTGDDGWAGTCPADEYEPNRWGLHNMVGNVWEWTTDRLSERAATAVGPTGDARIVTKGGSYLCHESYCRRYRPSGRIGSTVDSSAGNLGFRCAADA